MYQSTDDLLKSFPHDFQDRVKVKGQALIKQYDTLQELRKDKNLTQKQIAALLEIEQVSVSKLESRSDMLLSTLSAYVKALGGKLNLSISFPNQEPVALSFKKP